MSIFTLLDFESGDETVDGEALPKPSLALAFLIRLK